MVFGCGAVASGARPSPTPFEAVDPRAPFLLWYLIQYQYFNTLRLVRKKHRRVLERVFATPTPPDIRWRELEATLHACGVEIVERKGSRVGLRMVRDIGLFLRAAGVEP